MNSDYKILLATLKRELPILKFIFSRNLIVLLTSLTFLVLFFPIYLKGIAYTEQVIPNLLSNLIKKNQYLIRYFTFEQVVKFNLGICVVVNFTLLSVIFSIGIAWMSRQMNENYVHRDFILVRPSGFANNIKFVLNWLLASVFINGVFIILLMRLFGVPKIINFNMSTYSVPFFTLLYLIQNFVYYYMIKLNCFGCSIVKREVPILILKEGPFILSSVSCYVVKVYQYFRYKMKMIVQTGKMITQASSMIVNYFSKKTAFYRFFLLNETITTIPSILPILMIYELWSKYRSFIFRGESYLSFIAELLLAAVTVSCCLFMVWRWIITRYIPKNFEFIRTGRLRDDAKFYFALSFSSFVFNLILSVPLAIVTNKSLLLSPGSFSQTVYLFISFYCIRAMFFYFMTKKRYFGFSIQEREMPLSI